MHVDIGAILEDRLAGKFESTCQHVGGTRRHLWKIRWTTKADRFVYVECPICLFKTKWDERQVCVPRLMVVAGRKFRKRYVTEFWM